MSYFKLADKHSFFLLLFFIFSCSVFSQTNSPIAPKLNTTGMANEDLTRNIFSGNFAAIDFDRDEPSFSLILGAYINAYWEKCGNSLPNNKVEIIYQDESGTHSTGIYASPAMYEAQTTVNALHASDFYRFMFRTLKQDNPISVPGNYDKQAIIIKQDMESFLKMNDCNSAGMKRFEKNLYAFAMNTLPVALEGSQIPRANPDVLLKDQVFGNLIDDLIKEQSKTWVYNQYVHNSVTEEKIVSKDNEGRPASVTANYRFMLGRQDIDGNVRLTFIEGLPNCLYFSDNPSICRTANHRIVLNYATGKYINADTLYKTAATFYTVDKTDTNWVVKFKAGAAVEIFYPNTYFEGSYKNSGEELIIKPGQWLVITGRAADFVHGAEFTVDHRPKPVLNADGKVPDFSIDKTTYRYWVVRFYRPWYLNAKPGYRTYGGGGDSDFYVPLDSGQYVERVNTDDSYTLLKDLDRRNGNLPPYTVNKTKRPDLWIVTFNTSMNIRVLPESQIFYIVEEGSGKQLRPGEYVEKKNEDGSISLLKDLDHR